MGTAELDLLARLIAAEPELAAPALGPALFLRAGVTPELAPWLANKAVACRQSWRPEARALAAAGLLPAAPGPPDPDGPNPDGPDPKSPDPTAARAADRLPAGPLGLAILRVTRSRDETLFNIARAMDALAEGGILLVLAANSLGGARWQQRLAELSGQAPARQAKFKCRAAWARRGPGLDPGRCASWRAKGAPRRLTDPDLVALTGGPLWSQAGIFAAQGPDPGSLALARALPSDLAGRGADFGAGAGFLARAALARNPEIESLALIEAEGRALELAMANLGPAETGHPARITGHWWDLAPAESGAPPESGILPESGAPPENSTGPVGALDFVLMNPPFHAGPMAAGRRADPALGRAFIDAAAAALRSGGRLFLVANRHLPYEEILRRRFARLETGPAVQGYRVVIACR